MSINLVLSECNVILFAPSQEATLTSRPWVVVRKSAWKSNFVATPWGIDFLWFNAQYHRCPITTKSSQVKNLPNTEKMGDDQ
jgi:hypothetical protein